MFARYNSLQDFLMNDDSLFDGQEPKDGRESITRVDVYHPSNLTLDPNVLNHIGVHLENAVISVIPVLECLQAKSAEEMTLMQNASGIVITLEYI